MRVVLKDEQVLVLELFRKQQPTQREQHEPRLRGRREASGLAE